MQYYLRKCILWVYNRENTSTVSQYRWR